MRWARVLARHCVRAGIINVRPGPQVRRGDHRADFRPVGPQIGDRLGRTGLAWTPTNSQNDYITVDHNKQAAQYIRVPSFADVPYPVKMEPNLVVEFYSR